MPDGRRIAARPPHHHAISLAYWLAIALGSTACADKPTGPPAEQPAVAASVSVTVNPATIGVGTTTTAVATALDTSGNALAGVAFSWATSSAAVATVDSNGVVHGVAPGTVTISATGAGQTGSATVSVGGDLLVRITSPQPNAFFGDSLTLNVSITPKYQLASVVVTAGSASVPIPLTSLVAFGGTNSPTRTFNGTIRIPAAPSGLVPLTVTATDVTGNSGSAALSLRRNYPPVITIVSPAPYDVSTGTVTIEATCTDVEKVRCASLTVQATPTTVAGTTQQVASGTTSVNASVSLAAFNGALVDLTFTATDSAGQTRTAKTNIAVIANAHLQSVVKAPGLVLDVEGARLLYRDTLNARDALRIRAGTADVTVLDTAARLQQVTGYLTPAGALYYIDASISSGTGYSWRDFRGATTVTLGPYLQSMLAVHSPFAAYSRSPVSNGPLYVRDLRTGTETAFGTRAVHNDFDVSDNGHLAYWTSDYQIVLDTVQITSDTTVWNVYPVTDGTRVVYFKRTKNVGAVSGQIVAYLPAVGEVTLGSLNRQASRYSDYQIEGGWIAYVDLDATRVAQVWSYSPTGTKTQVSHLAASSSIEALSSTGDIVFSTSTERFVARPPYSTVTSLGTPLGSVLWRDGHFVVLVRGTVLQVVY